MSMKLGIIAGNRTLPILLAQRVQQLSKKHQVIVIGFNGETARCVSKYANKTYWVSVGDLGKLRRILAEERIKQCVVVGQINPLRIFKRKGWDSELVSLVDSIQDFRPHTIFSEIITYLEKTGIIFLDSTLYLKNDLAEDGIMNNAFASNTISKDIDFGVKMISKFVDLDVGQTIVVKSKSVVALESLEGTDKTIKRAYRLAGKNCMVFKFSKTNQDFRFDVPVVGLSTLKLLKFIGASGLVLESDKVIIIQKKKFLCLAKKWKILVIGKMKINNG